jgi:hypothetical protein
VAQTRDHSTWEDHKFEASLCCIARTCLKKIKKVKYVRYLAGHRWLTPVILAAQEADIRRIIVQSQPGQIVCETLSQKKTLHKKIGLVE